MPVPHPRGAATMPRLGPSVLPAMPPPGNPTQPPRNPVSSLPAELRERVLQNPGNLQAIVDDLHTTNPELFQRIQQNPQIVQEAIMNPSIPPPPPAPAPVPAPATSQFTTEERAAIDRVLVQYNE